MSAPRPARADLSLDAWRTEEWRRQTLGLAAHPTLRDLDEKAIRACIDELNAQHGGLVDLPPRQRIAWFGPRDDRRDIDFTGPGVETQVLDHARRTCYLIGAGAVATRRDGRARLHWVRYGDYHGLCSSEPFYSQPIVIERDGEAAGGYGYTGYLIDDRRVLTCWHGWDHLAYRPQVAVFGFAIEPGSSSLRGSAVSVSESDVVPLRAYPAMRGKGAASDSGAVDDWVVLELERPVRSGFPAGPLVLAEPRTGRSVYTLGFPSGLPLKIADNAQVLSIEGRSFRTNLDTFAGNSGSPVFDARSHELLGIVVEGEKGEGDFEASPSRGCYVSNKIDRFVTGQLSISTASFASALERGKKDR